MGLVFGVLQIAMALAFSTDNLIISQCLGPEAVTVYSVSARLFQLPIQMFVLMLMPLWPAYGEALARGDMVWLKKALLGSLGLAIGLSGACAGCLLLLGPGFLHWWVGPDVTPPKSLLVGLALWSVLSTTGSALAMFLNARQAAAFQVVCALTMGLANVPVGILFARTFGVAGVVWATVLVHGTCALLPAAIYVYRTVRALNREQADAGGSEC
jgi:O-antigen/teichoic acid export membrane protein